MLLELEEIKLEKDKKMHEASSFPGDGFYLVNDGFAYHLVSVNVNRPGVMMIPVNMEALLKYKAINKPVESVSDINKRLDEICTKIEDLKKVKAEIPKHSLDSVACDFVIELIETVQNRDVVKDKNT